jgi:hypothetical protein
MGNCGSSGGSSGAAARDKYEAGQKQTAAKLAVRTFPDVLPDVTPGQLFFRKSLTAPSSFPNLRRTWDARAAR